MGKKEEPNILEYLLMDQPLNTLWNTLTKLLTPALVIAAIWIAILILIALYRLDLALSILKFQMKLTWKIVVALAKLLWKTKKPLTVLCTLLALFFASTTLMPEHLYPLEAQVALALATSASATATLTLIAKKKKNLAPQTLLLAALSILTAYLYPTILPPTGQVNLPLLLALVGAALTGTSLALAYHHHYKQQLRKALREEIQKNIKIEEGKNRERVCLKVVRIPQSYLETLKGHAESQLAALRESRYAPLQNSEGHIYSGIPPFQSLIKFLEGRGSLAIRTDYHRGKATILLTAQPEEELPNIKKVLETHIPGLELKYDLAPPPQETPSLVRLEDAHPNTPTPLTPLHDYFLQNAKNGTIYVTVNHPGTIRDALDDALMNYSYKQFKKREKEEDKAISYKEEQKLHRIRKTLEEGKVKVGVYAATNGETPDTETLASVLTSGFRSNNGSGPARVSPQSPTTLKRLQGPYAEANLELTIPEAAAVLQIQTPVETTGFSVERTADFAVKSPGSKEEGLWLGWLTRMGKVLEERAYLNFEGGNLLALVAGAPGRGKSNLLQELVQELWERGVAVVVVEPIKKEHRRLSRILPVNIFTVGNERVSPLRLNPLEVPENVSLDSHISSLVSIFRYAFVMQAPLPEVLKSSLYLCYRNAGWKTVKVGEGKVDVRGVTPCLLNLVDALRQYVGSSTYDQQTRMNIESALITRIADLTVGSLGAVMLGYESTPFTVFKERPTIIELEEMGDEELTLTASLILLWIYSHLRGEGLSRRLRMVVVVEEAHRVAEDRGEEPSTEGRRRESLSNLLVGRLLKEGRGYGLGVVLADQNPTRLGEEAIKNTNTKIVFALPDAGDRRRLGESIGLNSEQIEAITNLKRGQAILWTQGTNPTHIQIRNIEEEMRRKGISTDFMEDAEVKNYMEPFFEEHPQLKEVHPHIFQNPAQIYQPQKRKNPIDGGLAGALRSYIEKVCGDPRWRKAYSSLSTKQERERHLLRSAQIIAKKYKSDPQKVLQTLKQATQET